MMNKNDIETLFKTHFLHLHRMAMAVLHDEDTARDIVHDVFSALLTKGTGASLPATYLFTAVRNRCLNHLRNKNARERIAQLYFLETEDYESEEWPDEATISRIYQIISDELPPQSRRAMELRYQQGLPFSSVALKWESAKTPFTNTYAMPLL